MSVLMASSPAAAKREAEATPVAFAAGAIAQALGAAIAAGGGGPTAGEALRSDQSHSVFLRRPTI